MKEPFIVSAGATAIDIVESNDSFRCPIVCFRMALKVILGILVVTLVDTGKKW